jgi:hypothetical protein
MNLGLIDFNEDLLHRLKISDEENYPVALFEQEAKMMIVAIARASSCLFCI